MNKAAYTAFVVFVTAILTLVATHFLSRSPAPFSDPSAASNKPAPLSKNIVEQQLPKNRIIAQAELAQHARIDDCWLAIRGKVYNVTTYIPAHPTRPTIFNEWCGKDATEGWNTKGYGRPHSQTADARLTQFFVGVLADK